MFLPSVEDPACRDQCALLFPYPIFPVLLLLVSVKGIGNWAEHGSCSDDMTATYTTEQSPY